MLASGFFQTTGALVVGISQPSFSAFLPKVLDAIISLTTHHVSFPNTQQKQQETKQGFYQINGFPHVLGAIDCTYVRIVPPAATEHLYLNRKHTHSVNVQAIVDHHGLITNIVAKYPGSIHDSFIFCHSTINQHFQDGRYGNGLLVASDPPYPEGTRSTELPDPDALRAGTNPEVLLGTKGKKKNAASDPRSREDSEEPETTRTPTETPAGGGEDEDGPTDGTQAGGKDQEAILQDPGHAPGRARFKA
ncbi:hypothetical protein NDU88_004781 [Pleurodeles waltl]|uniref:Putative nuclease HARBI1 n=1 Tax=Pleurodeles waltl TaxID=8319 RepID=A0AAV7UHD5_PLEWA|nr:hypothetical protein NDU88_004781 [Pleurodeles waltl]